MSLQKCQPDYSFLFSLFKHSQNQVKFGLHFTREVIGPVVQRKIIHIDADSFYASVEMRENPDLARRPIAVGGRPDGRGVVATCNYLARQYGVHSAMPSSHAKRLCPDLVFVRPNFPLYRKVSEQIRHIMSKYTEQIEPLSLDEAYLDVSESKHCRGSATLIAEAIRKEVASTIGITVSAGVAPNKFLAKIASDWNKPDGIFVITEGDVAAFVRKLDVSKINGVGKVTTKKLNSLGIHTCGELQHLELTELTQRFGKQGARLYELARGRDQRSVQSTRIRKSLSVEHTYDEDIRDPAVFRDKALLLHQELLDRARKIGDELSIHKRVVKIKFSDFRQTTLEEIVAEHPLPWQDLSRYLNMLARARQRSERDIRLMGMGIKLSAVNSLANGKQLDLFSENASDSEL